MDNFGYERLRNLVQGRLGTSNDHLWNLAHGRDDRSVVPERETIFKNPMTTAAAIDRLVHHSVILELNIAPATDWRRRSRPSRPRRREEGGHRTGRGVWPFSSRPRGLLPRASHGTCGPHIRLFGPVSRSSNNKA
jgi:hypothetical protein